MDKRYEVYCLVDSKFYDSTSQVGEQPHDFELGHAPVPEGWMASELEDWHVHSPVGTELPSQGWKVHVFGVPRQRRAGPGRGRRLLPVRRIAFKFRRSPDALLLTNAKYANRGSSGKFITIYPADVAQLEAVLTELGEVLDGSPGPYVLSDLRWGRGPLYVRYGGFAQRYCLSETGSLEMAIEDAEGRLVPDRRGPTFRLPEWVRLPAFLEPHLAARNSVKVDGLPYRIDRALHFSNGGGLYVGQHIQTGAQVVLKEARPYAGLDVDGTDAVARLRREQKILERLAGLDVVPAVHGSFTLGEHHFLALEFVDASPLRSAIAERYPLVKLDADERAIAEYTSWALDIQAKVERAVHALHARGVVIGDLHRQHPAAARRPSGTDRLRDSGGHRGRAQANPRRSGLRRAAGSHGLRHRRLRAGLPAPVLVPPTDHLDRD